MSTAEEIVSDFMAAWRRGNIDELLGYLTEDAFYHNIPMEPARGKAEIRAAFESFIALAPRIELEVLNSAGRGNLVFNERIDRFTRADGKLLELPVAGVFELVDGKISRWREYFDLASWQSLAE